MQEYSVINHDAVLDVSAGLRVAGDANVEQ